MLPEIVLSQGRIMVCMRIRVLILVVCVSVAVSAADKHDTRVSEHDTHVSKKDRQAAEKEFSRALEFQKSGDLDDALQAIAHAVELVPGNREYLTAREMLREQLSGTHVSQGNRLAQAGDKTGAAAQFREALSIDPENLYAQQLLRDVTPEDPEHQQTVELLASVDQINLAPAPGNKSIHVRGDTRSVYTQIGQVFNVSVKFDDGLTSRPLRFDLDDVDFYTAMRMVGKMTQSFWAPVSSYEIIVASDSTEMRKHYERLSVRTFYLGNAVAATDLTDITNVLRNIFDMRFVNFDTGRNADRKSVV